jgi:hypothetical protein
VVPITARGCVNRRKGSRDRREKTDSAGANTEPTAGMNGVQIEGRSGGTMAIGPGGKGMCSHEAGEIKAGIVVVGEGNDEDKAREFVVGGKKGNIIKSGG